MPLISSGKLEKIIHNALEEFYERRLKKVEGLKLKEVLKRKNPYLYRAKGFLKAGDIVDELLKAYITSSEEGIFGSLFFENIAVEVSGGNKSIVDSVDVEIHSESSIKAYAIKSGPSVFNSQSKARQNQAFNECRKRISSKSKHFEAIVGYGYGNISSTNTKYDFRELAGEAFWEDLTGDPEFYLKIVRLMGDKPKEHKPAFEAAYSKALNRFVKEFVDDFCETDGSINWEKLVRFNSGSKSKEPKA